ncbi:MAG TPA: zinc ABC transporter substrate-binding protein [Planctomycetota bacterium]|nr:zinc ABC transporter substrate-binding protein [Planctomycetota bacterium]
MKPDFRLLALGAMMCLGVLLTGCGGANPASTGTTTPVARGDGPLKAVCTVGMIADIVQRVGGKHVQVQSLMGPGTDPHLYKAREDDSRALSGADVIFYVGLNLEGKMSDLFVKMQRKKPVFAMSDPEYIDPKLLREPPEMEGHYDPHIWFDVSLWMKSAERVRDALAEVDRAHADDYKKNAEALLKEMGELHEWCKKELATIPQERRILITAHDAFGYFGRAYGVEVRGIQGISTEDQAPVAAINELVDLIVTRKVKAVFVESSVPRKNIEALLEGCKARGHTIVIGGELFSDAMGEADKPEGTYIGMVKHNVETIVKALK